jgi:putative transposase
VKELCIIAGYSKQAYYQQICYQAQKAYDEYLIVELIKRKRIIWKRGSGRNLFAALADEFREHNINIGRDKFFDILKRNELQVFRKSHKAITTMSYHHYNKHPNLIKDIIVLKANEVWVSDITYIWLTEPTCFGYLFLITDLYSHRIMGYSMSASLHVTGAIEALKMAIKWAGTSQVKDCIHHSDRGVQYCCNQYVKMLRYDQMQISMTKDGNPLGNAVAERVNGILKYEFSGDDKQINFIDLKKAKKQIPKFIDFYNNERPHSSIGRSTPAAAYFMEGELKRLWKNYYTRKEVTMEEGQVEASF